MLASLVLGSTADAQEPAFPFDAHGFHLAAHDADLRDPLVVRRPGPFDQGDWFLSGLTEYASSPLVKVVATSEGEQIEPIVGDVLAVNVSGGFAVHDRIRLDLTAPVYALTTSGTDQELSGPALGDIRGTMLVTALRPRHVADGGGFGLGVLGHLDLPTGPEDDFLGQRAVSGGLAVAATHELRKVTFSSDFGVQLNPGSQGIIIEYEYEGPYEPGIRDALVAGIGAGVLASDELGITLEATAMPPIGGVEYGEPETLFPAEALLSLRYVTDGGGFWTFGGAAGLTDGPGVAAFRLFVGGGFGAREPYPPPDVDPIGALQTTDACPLEGEVQNGYKDDDGCPDRLGTLLVEARYRGEPRSISGQMLGPEGQQAVHVGPRGLAVDAVPDTQWTVKARDGCLQGEATALASESGTELVVDLEPVLDARLLVEVASRGGEPLPGATVKWVSETPECVPAAPAAADSAGRLVQDLSSGTHTLVVTAPGYAVHEEKVALLAGDDRRLQVHLDAAKIVLEKRRIRILEKVQFEFGKAVLRPESHDLLNQVAAVIVTNPDIGRVEVAGHTDNKGTETFNQKLSADRADAVRGFLVGAGVAETQLISAGYGETRPIDTNRTERGRETNRRVEFNLVDAPADEGA